MVNPTEQSVVFILKLSIHRKTTAMIRLSLVIYS